jgi:hypothetical protein
MPFKSPQSRRRESNPALIRTPVGIDRTLYRKVDVSLPQSRNVRVGSSSRSSATLSRYFQR